MQNENPVIYQVIDTKQLRHQQETREWDDDQPDDLDTTEVFDLIRSINDPEHPLTLEQLNVVQHNDIHVIPEQKSIMVEFTPTIPHCSMATLIRLSIKVRLLRSVASSFKIDVKVKEGTHQSEQAINKQLQDKERVAAALENRHLLEVVNQCLSTTIK